MTNHTTPGTEAPPETPLFALPSPGEPDADGASANWHRQAWGDRDVLREYATRLKRFMPGGDKLTWDEAFLLAQYGMITGANVFRGEIYAYTYRGQVILVEGYKLLVRWAKRKSDYLERFEPLPVPDGWLGQRAYILPLPRHTFLTTLLQSGVDYLEAFRLVATFGDGTVRPDEMVSTKHGQQKAITPPVGWTWDQRCRTRALKQALRFAYGAPTVAEIARETWMVGGTTTGPQDWETALSIPGLHAPERERVAVLSHDTAKQLAELEQLTTTELAERLQDNRTLLRGEPDDGEI